MSLSSRLILSRSKGLYLCSLSLSLSLSSWTDHLEMLDAALMERREVQKRRNFSLEWVVKGKRQRQKAMPGWRLRDEMQGKEQVESEFRWMTRFAWKRLLFQINFNKGSSKLQIKREFKIKNYLILRPRDSRATFKNLILLKKVISQPFYYEIVIKSETSFTRFFFSNFLNYFSKMIASQQAGITSQRTSVKSVKGKITVTH